MKPVVNITTNTVQPILRFNGMATVDNSRNSQKATFPEYMASFARLKPLYIVPVAGSTATHARFNIINPNCYDPIAALEYKRNPPQYIADFNQGICSKTYGYGFVQDAIAQAKVLGCGIAYCVNPSYPIVANGLTSSPDYTDTFKWMDDFMSACATAGVPVRFIQVNGYEVGITGNKDIYPTVQSVVDNITTVVNYCKAKYPQIPRHIMGYNFDDPTNRLKGLNAALNNISGVTHVCGYFQLGADLDTWQKNVDRVEGEFPNYVTLFKQQFTKGQLLQIGQDEIKDSDGAGGTNNCLRGKFGEGLIYPLLYMTAINENLNPAHPNVITDMIHTGLGRALDGRNTLQPPYNCLVLETGMFINDGKVSVQLQNVIGAENLSTLAVKRGNVVELYGVNKSGTSVPLPIFKVNGANVNVTMEAHFGDPLDIIDNPVNITTPVAGVTINGYCFFKITTASIVAGT